MSFIANFTYAKISDDTCDTPILQSLTVTASTATLSWSAINGASSYQVRYRLASSSTWISFTTANSTISLNNLAANTTYIWQVRAICTNGVSSVYSSIQTIVTLNVATNCSAPTLSATNINYTSVTLSWSTSASATGYQIAYKASSATVWTLLTLSSSATTYTLSNLPCGSTYQAKIRAKCNSTYSAWSSTIAFATLSSPIPVINVTGSTTFCAGGSVLLNAGAGYQSYQWNNGATTQTIEAIESGSYFVTVVSPCGASASEPIQVAVNEGLNVTGTSVSPSCYGQASGAILTSVIGGLSPYSYLWSNGSTAQNLSGVNPGQYSLEVTDANGCTAQQDFVILEPPLVTINVPNDTVTCFGGEDAGFKLRIRGGSGDYSFVWRGAYPDLSVMDSVNNADSTGLYILSGLGEGLYLLKVTDNVWGCELVMSAYVFSPDEFTLDMESSYPTYDCEGTASGLIPANVNGGTPPYVYSWRNAYGNQIGTSNYIDALAPGDYSLIVTDSKGCILSQSFEVVQQSLLTNVNATNVTCTGAGNGTIHLTTLGFYGFARYEISGAMTMTVTDADGDYTLQNLPAGSYTINTSDVRGCNPHIFNVILVFIPPIITTVGATNFCEGSFVLLDAGEDYDSYQWSNGETTQAIIVEQSGAYYVTITSPCGAITSESIAVTAYPIPSTPDVNMSITQGDTILTSSISAFGYRWYRNDVEITNAYSQNYVVHDGGFYQVQLIGAAGCRSAKSSAYYLAPFRLGEAETVREILLYPNPTNGELSLSANWDENSEVAIHVTNALGQAVYSIRAKLQDQSLQFSIAQLSAGIYNINIVSGEKQWRCKVMKL